MVNVNVAVAVNEGVNAAANAAYARSTERFAKYRSTS